VDKAKTEADEVKKLVEDDVSRELARIQLKYEEAVIAIKSKGKERAQASDDKVEEAENSLEIYTKSLSNLQKELTYREELKTETVDLAQQLVDNMIAASKFILKMNHAADPSNQQLSAEYDGIHSKIIAYKTKKDMIDHGTFHA